MQDRKKMKPCLKQEFLCYLLTWKVIEKLIHDHTRYYFQRNYLLYSYQSGFKASHSTVTCLLQLTDMILNGAENGKHAGMILIDFQKAFDT